MNTGTAQRVNIADLDGDDEDEDDFNIENI